MASFVQLVVLWQRKLRLLSYNLSAWSLAGEKHMIVGSCTIDYCCAEQVRKVETLVSKVTVRERRKMKPRKHSYSWTTG